MTGYEIDERVVYFTSFFSPRSRRRRIEVGVNPSLMGRFDPMEWKLSEKIEHNAIALMLATLGWMTGNLLETGYGDKLSAHLVGKGRIDGYSFAERLRDLEPPADNALWKYVAAKIHWGWHYGLPYTGFDLADDLQLGLPVEAMDDEKTGLQPGQLHRIASLGIGEYWESEGTVYRPRLKLLQEFRDALPSLKSP